MSHAQFTGFVDHVNAEKMAEQRRLIELKCPGGKCAESTVSRAPGNAGILTIYSGADSAMRSPTYTKARLQAVQTALDNLPFDEQSFVKWRNLRQEEMATRVTNSPSSQRAELVKGYFDMIAREKITKSKGKPDAPKPDFSHLELDRYPNRFSLELSWEWKLFEARGCSYIQGIYFKPDERNPSAICNIR